MTLEQRIEIAEKRIVEAEERRTYFAEQFRETGSSLYYDMAKDETARIEKIREAILEALLNSK